MKRNKKSQIKDSRNDRIFGFIVDFLLIIIGLVTLFPLIFVLSASVSDPVMVNSGKVLLLPKGFNLDGYLAVFENEWVLTGYRNSFIYTVVGTFLNVLVTFMAAYSLSRKDMYGHRLITIYMVFTMWFGGGLIPTFIVVNKLGLVNRPVVMVILGLISIYNCIICRSFIQTSIPYELQEAARIDGCNDFGIVWKIVFPLSKPVLAILCLYYALGHWNGYFNALIYLDDRKYQTLQIFLREILIQNSRVKVDDSVDLEAMVRRAQMAQVMKYSLIVVASVPMLIIYPFVQKFFVQGVMIGSIKG
ncbi:MAG TPA: carbohydrate ABC transporter permease [Thermoclostridium sp.]